MERGHVWHLSDLARCMASAAGDLKNLRAAAYQSMKWLTEYLGERAMIASFFERCWNIADRVA
jgi:hypothetical protein